MTITEFLLACIAEDETKAREHPELDWDRDAWRLGYSLDGDYEPTDIAVSRQRVLAECEAKRRIVEREANAANGITYRRLFVLRDLASVYADHPDYDQEWAL